MKESPIVLAFWLVLLVWALAAVSVEIVISRRDRRCRRHRAAQPAPGTLEHQIGTIISTGMDRVDQLRFVGADAFQTLMPMPNGECWSVMVRRFPDEPSARVALGRSQVSA